MQVSLTRIDDISSRTLGILTGNANTPQRYCKKFIQGDFYEVMMILLSAELGLSIPASYAVVRPLIKKETLFIGKEAYLQETRSRTPQKRMCRKSGKRREKEFVPFLLFGLVRLCLTAIACQKMHR